MPAGRAKTSFLLFQRPAATLVPARIGGTYVIRLFDNCTYDPTPGVMLMKTCYKSISGLLSIALVIFTVATARAVTYDLNADWSDSANPNGVWTYREGTNALPHVTAWQGLSGDFVTAQPAWARNAVGSSNLPPWFKSSAVVGLPHDWQTGDVVMHSTDGFNGIGSGVGNVIWTSPINGTATISGNVWMGRDINAVKSLGSLQQQCSGHGW